MMSAVDEI